MPENSEPGPAMGPIPASERVQVIDILRGFALFGILVVNMQFFGSPIGQMFLGTPRWTGTADRITDWLIGFLAVGKFYSLFSFLFGLGLAVQMARAASRGTRFVPLYLRRLFVLLIIGLAHALLVWYGDILHVYAAIGFLLLLFRARSYKTLMIWTLVSFAIPILLSGGFLAYVQFVRRPAFLAQMTANHRVLSEQAVRSYSQGTFANILAQRAREVASLDAGLPFFATRILAMFLLGLYAGRRGVFQNIPLHLPFFRKVMIGGLAVGIASNFAVATWFEVYRPNPMEPTVVGLVMTVLVVVGAPAGCFFYVSGITLLVQKEPWRKRLAPLAAVGRMALSNYLLQSLVCTTLFYSYGLGLYGKVGPALGLALTVVIYLVQIPLSRWWLRRYQFGPLEWLWRSATYGKLQLMRAAAGPSRGLGAAGEI